MKKLFFIISFFLSIFVFGQEINKFYEISFLTSNKFRLGTKKLTQPIIPVNEFLSGFSLWIDNPQETEINLKIKDKNDSVIFEKNFILPVIAENNWGTEYFFSLGTNLKISSGEEYLIIIQPLQKSNLNLYFFYTQNLLQGTEERGYVFEGVKELLINDEPSDKILKLALYEGKENLPPVISDFQIEFLNENQTKVSFYANEPVTYKLVYNTFDEPPKEVGIKYFDICLSNLKKCELIFETEPGKSYSYLLEVEDYWENKTKIQGKFETPIFKTTQSEISTSSEIISSENLKEKNLKENSSKESQPPLKTENYFSTPNKTSSNLTSKNLQKESNNLSQTSSAKELKNQKLVETSSVNEVFKSTTSTVLTSTNLSTTINLFQTNSFPNFFHSNFSKILIIILGGILFILILKKIR